MKGKLFSFVLALQLLSSWVSATSRTFPPNDPLFAYHNQLPGQGLIPKSSPIKLKTKEGGVEEENEEYYCRGKSKIGSSPPRCKHKCYGCVPCEAIQVPTTGSRIRTHVGVQYTNYEPEGWKCKCGPSFYSP